MTLWWREKSPNIRSSKNVTMQLVAAAGGWRGTVVWLLSVGLEFFFFFSVSGLGSMGVLGFAL